MRKQASLSTWMGALVLGAATLTPLFDVVADDAHKHGKEGKATLEGTVQQVSGTCPNLRFTIAETKVETKDKTKYEDGQCKDVTNGQRVEVKGKLSSDGTLSAWKVEVGED